MSTAIPMNQPNMMTTAALLDPGGPRRNAPLPRLAEGQPFQFSIERLPSLITTTLVPMST
jgi:hypothetical protein